MDPKYRFSINERPVQIAHGQDLTKEYSIESGQRFFRENLSGKMALINEDYTWLKSQPFDTIFVFLLEKSSDGGAAWINYYSGSFMKTDCQWNDDDKKVSIKVKPIDLYKKVIDGMDKEFNLIKLAPEIVPVNIKKRPLLQMYVMGDSVVSCFLGGTYWQIDATANTDEEVIRLDYKFTDSARLREINIKVSTSPLAANGIYTGSMIWDPATTRFHGSLFTSDQASNYRVDITEGYFLGTWAIFISLVRISDSVVLFTHNQSGSYYEFNDYLFTLTPTPEGGEIGTVSADTFTYSVFARYMLDVEKLNSASTFPIPAEDIVSNVLNYRYVYPCYNLISYISPNLTNNPTEWGVSNNYQYYNPPSDMTQEFIPISRTRWRFSSVWFGMGDYDWAIERSGRKDYELRVAHPLGSVIKVLLGQIDPSIQHEETSDYSQFFYGDINPISFQKFRVLLTQKSNIISAEFSTPASKAPIKLKQIMDMIRDCFKCYWYIEDNKFKIEHVKFFRLGGTYTGTPKIGLDLTFVERVRGGKKWAFSTSEYEFDKTNMPERFEFTWGDNVSPAFVGFPIDIVSNYVEKGNIESVNVGSFTSDIDYMLLNPDDISKVGFALLGATLAECQANKPEDYHDNHSSGYNEISEPYFKLYTSLGGNTATINFYAISQETSVCTIVFLKNGVVISSQDSFNADQTAREHIFDVEIPNGADALSFNVVGVETMLIVKSIICKNSYDLPFVSRQFGLSQYIMQNGYMSWVTLQPNYYMHDLPAKSVMMNQELVQAISVEKNRIQTVQFPSDEDPNTNKLIKTYLGNGQIDKISINLYSRMNKTVLKYDTE